MIPDIPHPRDVFDSFGAEVAEQAFLDALKGGRIHHAWLLVGTEGVGKATFAYRAARRLLGARPVSERGLLGSDPADPVCRQVLGRAHPDLLVVQRYSEDGKTRRGIPVDEARALPEFFSKSPASAPYRVAIIDAADDLNGFGANAVLKTLEEPPERGILLLVSHTPGALLATLKSRCRRLRFATPPVALAQAWVQNKTGLTAGDAARVLEMARGAPGRAWRLAAQDGAEVDDIARALIDAPTGDDDGALRKMVDGFRFATGQARFDLLFQRLADLAHTRAAAIAVAGPGGAAQSGQLDQWAGIWESLIALRREVEAINLDRTDALFSAVALLRKVA